MPVNHSQKPLSLRSAMAGSEQPPGQEQKTVKWKSPSVLLACAALTAQASAQKAPQLHIHNNPSLLNVSDAAKIGNSAVVRWREITEQANRLLESGDYLQAESFHRTALVEAEASTNKLNVAISKCNLGLVHEWQGRYAEAEPEFREALGIINRYPDGGADVMAGCSQAFGLLLHGRGRYAEGEHSVKRAIAIRSKVSGQNDRRVRVMLLNLSRLFLEQRRYGPAKRIPKDLLADKAAEDSFVTAGIRGNFGHIYAIEGDFASAQQQLEQALYEQEKEFGSTHPNVCWPLNNLAAIYAQQQQYQKAEDAINRALKINHQTSVVAVVHSSRVSPISLSVKVECGLKSE
jgi:tetratricopeptide (TPR) repeat protein